MSFDAHRSRDVTQTPRRQPTSPALLGAADAVVSSPPTRRLRSDSRHTGSAPAAPSLSAALRTNATVGTTTAAAAAATSGAVATTAPQRARSKPATQRRTSVATPNTCRGSAAAAPAANMAALAATGSPPPRTLRGRRGELAGSEGGGGPSVPSDRAAQRTRARKVSGGAASARHVPGPTTPPPPPPPPLSSSTPTPAGAAAVGLTSAVALQRLREMSAPLSGVFAASLGHQQSSTSHGGAELTSPTLPCTPPAARGPGSTSCTLPPMLSHARTPPSAPAVGSAIPTASTPPGRMSWSVPLLPPPHATPDDEVDKQQQQQQQQQCPPHHVPLLTRFTQLMQPPLYSLVDSLSPPMPPIAAQTLPVPSTSSRILSNLSSSTLTDSAVTPHEACFTWSRSGSVNDGDHVAAMSYQQQQQPAVRPQTAAREETHRTHSPTQVVAARTGAASTTTTGGPSHTHHHHHHSNTTALLPPSTSTNAELISSPSADLYAQPAQVPPPSQPASLSAQGSRSHVVAAPRVVVSSSSASFGSSFAVSPTGPGLRPPPPTATATAATTQLPQQHVHKGASPTVAVPRDARPPATASPAPTRPPGVNGGGVSSGHVSVSAERRPLLAGAVRSLSKSPAGTPSTEMVKRALKDRRRRELYAWNAMLRQQNESGGQDAV